MDSSPLVFGLFLLIHQSTACTTPAFASLTVQSNFSLHHFLGVWYKIEWFTNEPMSEFDKWSDYTQSFELENNASQLLLVFNRARYMHEEKCLPFGPWLIIANNTAKMTLGKKDLNSTTNLNWPYYILKTDYDHYALIYGCMSGNDLSEDPCNEVILSVLSRTKLLSDEYLNELGDYIEHTLCVNLTRLEITSHGEKSCYTNSSLQSKIDSSRCLILLILYFFLIYK